MFSAREQDEPEELLWIPKIAWCDCGTLKESEAYEVMRGSIGLFEPAEPAIGLAKSIADGGVLLDDANMVPFENHRA